VLFTAVPFISMMKVLVRKQIKLVKI